MCKSTDTTHIKSKSLVIQIEVIKRSAGIQSRATIHQEPLVRQYALESHIKKDTITVKNSHIVLLNNLNLRLS